MPVRYSGRRRGSSLGRIVNSIKNVVDASFTFDNTTKNSILAKAVVAPSNTVTTDVSHGCVIKAIWISLDMCGLAASGVLQKTVAYLFKNPGNNLTPPGPLAVGSSNEKKFVIRMWSHMTMRNQDGNPPYHWEGWIRIPKRYQRMGTDDVWQLVCGADAGTGHFYYNLIYKWYT